MFLTRRAVLLAVAVAVSIACGSDPTEGREPGDGSVVAEAARKPKPKPSPSPSPSPSPTPTPEPTASPTPTPTPEPTASPSPTPTPTAGGRVAFSSNRSGTWQIYVAGADGSGVTYLTSGQAPAWSPDGSKIAFHRGGSIYVIDASGANERLLRAGWNPTWSPSGTELAFQSGIGSGGGVYVMNADGTNPRLVISHEFASPGWGDYCVCSPAWSPAGDRIAFVRANYDEGWGIFTINADGSGNPTLLRGNGFSQDAPSWSPGGARIAFATSDDSGDIVGSVTAGDSDFRVHASAGPGGYVGDPSWSPDGSSLLFVRGVPRGVPTRIYIVSDGSTRQLIPEAQAPANPDYFDREPSWSWAN